MRWKRLLTSWQPWWWSIHAHADLLWHQLRGHKVRWGTDCIDLWIGHLGCLRCDECPDSSIGDDGKHVGITFWSRDWRLLWRLMERICAWRGHGKPSQWMRWNGEGDSADDNNMVPTGEWCCSRCSADVPAPKEGA